MRLRLWLVLFAVALATAPAPALAQRARYHDDYDRPHNLEGRALASVHLGISTPTGNFGDAFDSGLGFGGSIGYGISRQVMLSAAISHHEFDHQVFNDESVSVTPFTFNADYVFPTSGKIMPWVGGGIGMYSVSDEIVGLPDLDETDFGLNFGAGIAAPIARSTLLGGGFRYHFVSGDELPDTEFFTFQIGLGFFL